MHFKKLISTMLLGCVVIHGDVYDKYKTLEDNAEKNAKDMNISGAIQKIDIGKYMQNAQNIYTKLKPLVEDEKNRIQAEQNTTGLIKNAASSSDPLERFIQKNRIYVFMSTSVPKSVWYEYGKFISDNKLLNASLLLRGCIDGCTRVMPTLNYMKSIIEYDKNHKINPSILIDPLLFDKYKIKEAPCVVYSTNVEVEDYRLSEGLDTNSISDKSYMSCGDWSLMYHLKNLHEQSKDENLNAIISKLENK